MEIVPTALLRYSGPIQNDVNKNITLLEAEEKNEKTLKEESNATTTTYLPFRSLHHLNSNVLKASQVSFNVHRRINRHVYVPSYFRAWQRYF